MRKINLVLAIIISSLFSMQWENINSSVPKEPKIEVLSSDISNTELKFSLNGFYLNPILIDGIEYSTVSFPSGAMNLESGMPNLYHKSTSIIIPDYALMNYEIISSDFIEYENINIAPSKGNISRLINPETVEYTFDEIYESDSFYPSDIVKMNDPYILRDLRGQAIEFTPFQYNATDKTLRVYTNLIVRFFDNGIDQRNVMSDRMDNNIPKEYQNIYKKQFINYNNDLRFDYLVDQGNMLIISYGSFMDSMLPLVDWKNMKGVPTEMINVSDIGSSSSSITSFVQSYYYDNGLTFLLLVGDIAQIPSPSVSGSASDMSYGCIIGNDFYPEVIVGRMSGSTPAQIDTQVERSVEYERYPQLGVEWYDNALGVASNQGPGFGGMTDDDFNDYLWDTVLSDFTYDSYQGIYDGSGGSDSQGITAINNGVSLINYTGHGSISSWGNGASLNTTQINQLTNNNKLPFVITVGCNVGEFNSTNECYAEAWQRATNGGEPAGGIAHFGSTISQSWEPPMHGQYGMNLIITESYDEHLTRSMGGITTNGCMYMNDAQGSSGINETKYWTFFGDPSANIRTAPPTNLNVTYNDLILIGQNEFVVDIGEDGALAALSRDGELLASAYSSGGVSILTLDDETVSVPGELDLVVTGFNAFPYESTVTVLTPEGAYVSVNDISIDNGLDDMISFGEQIDIVVTVENVGNDSASDITTTLTQDSSPYVNIIDGYDLINSLEAGETQTINLSFTVNDDAPYGHSFTLSLEINSESNTYTNDFDFTVESLIESFESNGLSDLDWVLSGSSDWFVDPFNSSNGEYSAKSGVLPDADSGGNLTTDLSLTMTIAEDGYISFNKKVSCEEVGSYTGTYYDYLAFYIDGVEQAKWAGEIDWSQNSFSVSSGDHTFMWRYNKDQGVTAGQDAVWVDNIVFPPTFSDSSSSMQGDVNQDGEVSILDVIVVINMVLGMSEMDMLADINSDGTVDVLDIITLVNIILDI